ncbi:dipeptide epimerase [Macrococcus sp. EM39E]|uniref:dipeptide epimerase n=1 Tax=Macrococcus animalis TaxID=3395467 RepID=UPI0039BEC724
MIIEDIIIKRQVSQLKKPFKTALRQTDVIESIIVFINTDRGLGVGEAVPTPAITGETLESIVAAIKWIKARLIGMRVASDLLMEIQTAIVGNTSAKAALDMAIYDLLSQEVGLPLYQYLNKKSELQTLSTSHTVSLNGVGEMTHDAASYVEEKFESLKVKLGNDVDLDLARIHAIYDVVPDVTLSIDANQGWSEEEAIRFIEYLNHEKIQVDCIEQPLYRKDYLALSRLGQQSDIPIMADESLFDMYDANVIAELGGVSWFNIKLMKSGGIYGALRIHQVAQAKGIQCMLGSMMESHIALTAAMHLAIALEINKIDFDAPFMLKEKLIIGGISYDGPKVSLTDRVGLGIDNKALWEALIDDESL